MTRETELLDEVSRIFDHPLKSKLWNGDTLVNTEFSEGKHQIFAKGQPEQETGLSERIETVSQSTGTEVESKSPRRGSMRKQEKVSSLPLEGSAGVKPKYDDAGRGSVVVRDGEEPLHGEGTQELSCNSELGNDKLMIEYQISVPEIQTRLAQKATRVQDHRFNDLYSLLTWEQVLNEAAERLLGNPGSKTPGLDGLQRDVLKRTRGYHMRLLQQQLKDGTFQPMPVKRVYIPKKNGKMRPLGIPTIYDRWVQMALKIVLEPIFESDFLEFSHGFRPKRSCHTAIAHIHRLTIQPRRKAYWVIEGDIKGFFDHVHHKKLMSLLRTRVRDEKLLNLIWKFLRAGVMENQLFTKSVEGTPQGGVVSPLLANVYLNHFDHWFAEAAMLGDVHAREKNRKAGHANFMMVRYADDFVVFSNGTREETAAFKTKMKEWLASDLKLELSEEKTAITHFKDGFNFLGFTIKKTIAREGKDREVVVHYPSTDSVERAVRKIKELTSRNSLLHSKEDQIDALNSFLKGWGEYFRHSSAKEALQYVGSRAFMRMWKWLVTKEEHRHGWRTVKERYYRNNTWEIGKRKLFVLQSMKVEYPFYRKIVNPFLDVEQAKMVEEPVNQDPFVINWHGGQTYGNQRKGDGPTWNIQKARALDRFDNECAVCGAIQFLEVHHIKARAKGGSHEDSNLIPLCRSCHRQVERRNSEAAHKMREKIKLLSSGEPDALKGASPVREETL